MRAWMLRTKRTRLLVLVLALLMMALAGCSQWRSSYYGGDGAGKGCSSGCCR